MTGHFPILSLLLWLPIAGVCWCFLAGRTAPQTVRWLSLFVAVLSFAVSVPLWTQFDTSPRPCSSRRSCRGSPPSTCTTPWCGRIAMPLILLTTFVTVLV